MQLTVGHVPRTILAIKTMLVRFTEWRNSM